MIRISKYNGQNCALIFFLLCLLCTGQYLGISAVNLGLTILIVGVACFASPDDLFVIMYATLPLYNIINYRVGTYSMHYLIIGLFVLKYMFHEKISAYKLLIFLLLFTIRLFAADFVLLISWSLLVLPLILTLDSPIWKTTIGRIVFWMNMSMLLSCLAGYLMMITNRTIYTHAYLYISGVQTIRFAGLSGDSVVFGQSCALIIAINLVYCFFNSEKKRFYVVSSALLAMAALLAYSKMALLCMLLVFVLFLALYAKEYSASRKQILKAVIVAGLLLFLSMAVVLALINYSGSSALILGYIDRFTREDLSTGRFSLWGVYLEMLVSKLRYLFLPMTSEALSAPVWNPSTGSYVTYVHSLYLETIAAFGWCASILIFFWIGRKVYVHFMRRRSWIFLFPIFVLLFMGFGSHGNFEYQFYLQFALALSFLNREVECALLNMRDVNMKNSVAINSQAISSKLKLT